MTKKETETKTEVAKFEWRGLLKLGLGSSRASLIARAAELATESGDSVTGGELGELIGLVAHIVAPYSATTRYANELENDIEETKEKSWEAAKEYAEFGDEDNLNLSVLLAHKAAGMEDVLKALKEKLEATPEDER